MRRAGAFLGALLLLFACGSDTDPDTIAFASTVPDRATDQISLDELPASSSSTSQPTDTTGASPTGECEIEPMGSHVVDVSVTDPDGGLNLRSGAGVQNEVVLVLPAGTEVTPLGECALDENESRWWNVQPVTDSTIEGWVSEAFLEAHRPPECPAGVADLTGQLQVTSTRGDFDGDGSLDTLYLGNDPDAKKAVMQVEFANGGFAGGLLDIEMYADVLAVFRPIGAAHDIIMFRDVYGSGASTSMWLLAEAIDCEPFVIDGLMQGGSVGWGAMGYCLEPTSLGIRVWGWSATDGNTHEERQANRVDFALHYRDSDFVDATASTTGRECVEPGADTGAFGNSIVATDLSEIAGSSLADVQSSLARHFGANRAELVGELVGQDSQGGWAIWLLSDLHDDSIDALRLKMSFTIERDSDENVTKYRANSGEFRPSCSRGVTDSGLCV